VSGLSEDDRRRLDELFDRAADLPVAEHEAFVERECGTNETLRRELARLLAGLAGEDRLSRIRVEALLPTGSRVGPYAILEKLGEGGMGEVYLAEQTEPLTRRIALKLIKVGMDTRQVIARFDAERQALARMDHPGIAKVLDAGSTETGRPYFVMEYIEGAPILDYCDTNKVDTKARLGLFVQVCHAIQHAHQKGVIHRDIKPSNVLVTVHDGVPVPKVIDFGVAKATDRELTAQTLFTEQQQMIGTPMYMSPEQAQMGGLDVDTRSDIYSLGVLLYEILTGTTPFDGQDLRERGFAEMMRVIREETPKKPSTRISTLGETATEAAAHRRVDVRRLGFELRGDLDWIVMQCLEKDRARRYETASSLAADIERHLADEPVVAGPPSASYRLRKFVRRHRAGVIAASLVAAVLLLGVAGTTWGMLWALNEKQRADDETARLEKVAGFHASQFDNLDAKVMGTQLRVALLAAVSPEKRAELSEKLDPINFTDVAKGMLEHDLLAPALAAIDRDFRDQPLVEAQLLVSIGTTSFHVGLLDLATEPARRVLEIRRQELGEDDPDTLLALSNVAQLLESKGELEAAEKQLRKTLDGFRTVLGPEHPSTLVVLRKLGRVVERRGKLDEARECFQHALDGHQRLLGDDDSRTLDTKNEFANLLIETGDYKHAEQMLREVLAGQERAHGDDDRRTLLALNNLGGALHMQGKLDEAKALYEKALKGYQGTVGSQHAGTLVTMTNIAGVLLDQGEVRKAGKMFRDALEGQMRMLGARHEDTITTVTNLGEVFSRLGKPEKAEEYACEAYRRASESLGPDHAYTLQLLDNVGVMLQRQNKFAEAEEKFREAVEGDRKVLTPGHPETGRALHNLAFVIQMQGRPSEATKYYEQAFESSRQGRGSDHPWTLLIGMNLGRNYKDLGEVAKALPLFRAAYRGRARDPVNLRLAAYYLFDACVKAGEHAKAKELLPEVRAVFPKDSPVLADDLGRWGAALLRAKMWQQAESVLTLCVQMCERGQPGTARAAKLADWKAKLEAARSGQGKE